MGNSFFLFSNIKNKKIFWKNFRKEIPQAFFIWKERICCIPFSCLSSSLIKNWGSEGMKSHKNYNFFKMDDNDGG